MRLIDADKLINSLKCTDNGVIWVALDYIERVKTVEAVPIEWIEKFRNSIFWEDAQDLIDIMLAAWEEENESKVAEYEARRAKQAACDALAEVMKGVEACG